MKKLMSVLLLAVMVLSCLAVLPAQAEDLTGKTYVNDTATVATVYPKSNGHCYIRSAPSSSENNIVVTAYDDDEVYVYYTGYTRGGKDFWAYVRHTKSEQFGYMWADNLEYNTDDFDPNLTDKVVDCRYAIVDTIFPRASGHSYIRSKPNSAEENLVVTAYDDDEVIVYYTGYTRGGKDFWAYVKHVKSEQFGYMWADNLDYSTDDFDRNLTGKAVYCHYATVDTTVPRASGHSYIRSKPNSVEENIVVTAYDGDEVIVYYTGYANDGKDFWAFVKHTKSEQFGYMWGDNLK